MIKIAYNFKTLSPFHTGSDISAGTLKSLRRQVCIVEPEEIKTNLSEDQSRDAVVLLHLGIWRSINKDGIKGKRMMGIWDEFYNKIVAAARSQNKYQYLESLCRSWGITSIKEERATDAFEKLSDFELLNIVRNETMYVCYKTRAIKDIENTTEYHALFLGEKEKEELNIITNVRSDVPCISGNTFRGRLRRYIMKDFFDIIEIKSIDKRVYHTLFSGGFLDQATNYEDIEKVDTFIENCPAIGLFGSAIGNMTIEGDLQMGWAYPLCKERGTSKRSYWSFVDTVFQTKHDSSKTEKDIELTEEKEGNPQQMKYEYECFAVGTEFEHRMACTSEHPLIISAFSRMIKLFKEKPFIGGMSSVGNGEIDLSNLDYSGDDTLYLGHLEGNKEKIKEYWENAKI